MDNLPLRYAVYDTAIGDVTLIANEKRLVGLLFGSKDPLGAVNDENTALYDGIIELNQYCYGQRKYFKLRLEPFRDPETAKVYEEISKIPYGETRYSAYIAEATGTTVARVNELLFSNPLPIFVPTHRVIESPTSLGHLSGCDEKMYESGEDIALKQKLIDFEKENAPKIPD